MRCIPMRHVSHKHTIRHVTGFSLCSKTWEGNDVQALGPSRYGLNKGSIAPRCQVGLGTTSLRVALGRPKGGVTFRKDSATMAAG
jgi:hypothetical protein